MLTEDRQLLTSLIWNISYKGALGFFALCPEPAQLLRLLYFHMRCGISCLLKGVRRNKEEELVKRFLGTNSVYLLHQWKRLLSLYCTHCHIVNWLKLCCRVRLCAGGERLVQSNPAVGTGPVLSSVRQVEADWN